MTIGFDWTIFAVLGILAIIGIVGAIRSSLDNKNAADKLQPSQRIERVSDDSNDDGA